jgi:hypothetical protein
MGARTGSCLLKTLTAVCFAILMMAVVPDRVVAAKQSPSAQASTARCPHPLLWRPTERELHRIVARHFGWVPPGEHVLDPPGQHNAYLDNLKPAYPDWRREASNHPERANLCNANLTAGANLIRADLTGADLSGAVLTDANLNGADLSRADLRDANLNGANLIRADLSRADLTRRSRNQKGRFVGRVG